MSYSIKNNPDKETAQQRIKRIILTYGKEYDFHESDVAWAIGLSPQALNYQLNNAVKFDTKLEEAIDDFFRKKGIPTNDGEECEMLNDLFLEFNSMQAQQVSILSNQIRKSIKDKMLHDQERADLKLKVKQMRINFNSALDELEKIIDHGKAD